MSDDPPSSGDAFVLELGSQFFRALLHSVPEGEGQDSGLNELLGVSLDEARQDPDHAWQKLLQIAREHMSDAAEEEIPSPTEESDPPTDNDADMLQRLAEGLHLTGRLIEAPSPDNTREADSYLEQLQAQLGETTLRAQQRTRERRLERLRQAAREDIARARRAYEQAYEP